MTQQSIENNFDVVILGGGPAGYVSAIRLSQLNLKVAIVEKRTTLGGTCLNVGCVPTKTLLASTHLFSQAKEKFSEHGITYDNLQIDIDTIRNRKNQVVDEVTKGIAYLMKKNKISIFQGKGKIISNQEVNVADIFIDKKNEIDPHGQTNNVTENKSKKLITKNIIIATGSSSVELEEFVIDNKQILDSTSALKLQEIPKHLIVIGAGVIGLELASVYNRLGSTISIIEMLPNLFYKKDKQLGRSAQRYYEKDDFKFYFNHKITQVNKINSNVMLTALDSKENKVTLEGSHVLVAVGRKANIENIGLKENSIELTAHNKVKVNPLTFETNIKNIYAIGDVIEGAMLAHKASEEGIAVAEVIAKKPITENTQSQEEPTLLNYEAIPQVIYTQPEIAFIGKGEDEVDKSKVIISKVFFKSNARAKSMGCTDGLVKLIMNKETKLLEGLWIISENASEMISAAIALMEHNLSVEKLANQPFAHPTLSESIKEAALLALKKPIHL